SSLMTQAAWPRLIRTSLTTWNGYALEVFPSPLATGPTGDGSMMRYLLGVSLFLLAYQPGAAALPTEANKPYRLQIVLRIAEHPTLTNVFQDQVQRELRDNLQAALGDLAKVEVVRNHPRLEEVEAKGLQHALDGWN